MATTAEPVLIEEGMLPVRGTPLFCRAARPGRSAPRARLGLLHGYGDHSGRYVHFMRWLAERGFASQAIDLRGHGRSGGRRGFVRDWSEYLEDVAAFLEHGPLGRSGPEDGPLFLLGHSHGALILTALAPERLAGVAGCIFTAPYFGNRVPIPAAKRLLGRALSPVLPWVSLPTGLRDEWMTADAAMLRDAREDPLLIRRATPRWYVGMCLRQEAVPLRAAEFRLPLLLLMGEADPVADPGAARRFYEAAGSTDKTFRLYPGLRHELLREAGREQLFGEIAAWLERRSPPAAEVTQRR